MTTTLYLVRHGETDYNRASIMQGRRIDSSLNASGRRQAEALARRMSGVSLDAIYTSTLARARETALAVARLHPHIPVHQLSDLEEMSWGILDGSRPGVGIEEAYARWRGGDYAHAVEEGESILDVQTRALRAIRGIVDDEAGNTILVVTHGRFLRVLLASLLEGYGLARMDDIRHANTSVNHLVFDGRSFRARLLNCTLHLQEPTPISLN